MSVIAYENVELSKWQSIQLVKEIGQINGIIANLHADIASIKRAHRVLLLNRAAYNEVKTIREHIDEWEEKRAIAEWELDQCESHKHYTADELAERYTTMLEELGFERQSRKKVMDITRCSYESTCPDAELSERVDAMIEEVSARSQAKLENAKKSHSTSYLHDTDDEKEQND